MAELILGQLFFKPDKPCIITVGTFDGVHLGHQKLFSELIAIAREHNAYSVIITFQQHPLQILRPELQVRLLTLTDEKFELLSCQPVDYVLALDFTEQFAALTAHQFLSDIMNRIPIIGIVTGYDNVIGSDRVHGSTELGALCNELNIQLHCVEQLKQNDYTVGSTYIRGKIINDELKTAARLLGRPYSISGRVEHGLRAGKGKMGIPTANLIIPSLKLMPSDGVYAARALWNGHSAFAATNVMYARLKPDNDKLPPNIASLKHYPMLANDPKLVETYLLNIPPETNLYEHRIEIQLLKRIRGLIQFENWTELKHQILRDVEKINMELRRWVDEQFF